MKLFFVVVVLAVITIGCPDPQAPQIIMDGVSPIGDPLTIIRGSVGGGVNDLAEVEGYIYIHLAGSQDDSYSLVPAYVEPTGPGLYGYVPGTASYDPFSINEDGRWEHIIKDIRFYREFGDEVVAVLFEAGHGGVYTVSHQLHGGDFKLWLEGRPGFLAFDSLSRIGMDN